MIRISQLKLPITHTPQELQKKAAEQLNIAEKDLLKVHVVRQSVDARKKKEICYSYILDVETTKEKSILKRKKLTGIAPAKAAEYCFVQPGKEKLHHRPVIIGSGPAGLFCGYLLAKHGYRPMLIERGEAVDKRQQRVRRFWQEGRLDPDCNVQFGEGGAGTFSDGKLNTLVKDAGNRNREVLKIFAAFGADPSICYVNKPHIGTDVLSRVVVAMREEILRLGGTVHFGTRAETFHVDGGRLRGLTLREVKTGQATELDTQAVVLAVGHSARDTFAELYQKQVPMEAKAFAVGLRVQHPQELINQIQYGFDLGTAGILGPASYKLTHQCRSGRGVYSFCMCPGGWVVNASSEPGRLAVNGMSYQARDGENANSAVIVTVTPADFAAFGGDEGVSPLAGIAFQRELEQKAFAAGAGSIPLQLFGDFCQNRISTGFGGIKPMVKGHYAFANLREILPAWLSASLIEGMTAFGRVIPGFDRDDAVFAGVESRTSSPVRIIRSREFESAVAGLFPCGEGAGYAGGITSAAMDGMKVAEEIARRYAPWDEDSD